MLPLMLGMAALGTAGGIVNGLLMSSASRRATGSALSGLDQAQQMSQSNFDLIKSLYAPYIAAGTNSLNILQGRMYSAAERDVSTQRQRLDLQAKIAKYSTATDWKSFPVLTGEMASERRATLFTQAEYERKRNLAAAQLELKQFDKEQSQLAPLMAKQDAENNARMGRITSSLDQIARLSDIPTSLAGIRTELQNDPVYQFRLQEGERAINRAAAKRGQFFSGSAIGSLADFSMQLTGEETDKYLNRKMLALNAAVTGLGAELGEQNQGVMQAYNLANLGLNATAGEAQAGTAATQAGATLAAQAGQTQAQGQMGQAQAWSSALGNISGTFGSLATLSLLSQSKVPTTEAEPNSNGSTAARRTWANESPY